jgi:predicted site-specific integrase-resolvase
MDELQVPVQPPAVMTRAEAAEYLEITPRTFDRWRDAGVINRADTPRPGTWFKVDDVVALKISRNGAKVEPDA